MNIENYMQDGANYQARAVLMFLQGLISGSVFAKNVSVDRWSNCREQGYIISYKDLNIIFFEHRNTDMICAVKWKQFGGCNPLNINTANFRDVYETKWDVSYEVEYGEVYKMASWILNELGNHWKTLVEQEHKNIL